jgi:hypothetical protein
MPRTLLFVLGLAITALVVLPLAPREARAEEDAALAKAKESFTLGQQLYLQGKYAEAAKAFVAAYGHKPIPAFLFNAAVAFEKAKEYAPAIEHFKKYLAAAPTAADAAQIKERIAALEKALAAAQPEPVRPPPDGMAPDPAREPPRARVVVVPVLPAIQPKGVVSVSTKPAGATVYLKDKLHKLGESPWQGDLPTGQHELLIEARGYRPEKKTIEVTPDRIVDVYVALSQEHYLGWVEITANRPGALIFIDRKDVGAVARTPYTGFLNPGKHKVWVQSPGYVEAYREIDVASSVAHRVHLELKPVTYGWLNVRGNSVNGAEVKIDGKVVCKAPCIEVEVTPGPHQLVIERKGYKPLRTTLQMSQRSISTATVDLAEKPSRVSAYVSYGVAAGFLAGGIAVGFLSKQLEKEVKSDIGGGVLVTSADPRLEKGRRYAYVANGLFGLAGITAIFGIYYTFADRGPKSKVVIMDRRLTIAPELSPTYAGLRTELRF